MKYFNYHYLNGLDVSHKHSVFFLIDSTLKLLKHSLLINFNLQGNLNVSCKPQILVDKVAPATKFDLFKNINIFATGLGL